MDDYSPARLYALVVGAVLTIAGIVGFFYESSFDTGEAVVSDDVFGILAVNGWHNVVHLASGLVGLAVAGSNSAARAYALVFGLVYTAIAIWGFVLGSGTQILLDFLPLNTEDNVLHLALGLLGLAAAATSPLERRTAAPA